MDPSERNIFYGQQLLRAALKFTSTSASPFTVDVVTLSGQSPSPAFIDPSERKIFYGQQLLRAAFKFTSTSASPFTVEVVTLSGQCLQFDGLQPEDSLSSLRDRVAKKFEVLPDFLQLCNGWQHYGAVDMERSLLQLGIAASTVLTCILRKPDGKDCFGNFKAGWSKSARERDDTCLTTLYQDSTHGKFFALYEGCPIGRRIAEFVERAIAVHYETHGFPADPVEDMSQIFEVVDKRLCTEDVKSYKLACTACCCMVFIKVLYTAHVGNIRAVLSRGGVAVRLTSTSDHKATDPVEARRIVENGGTVFKDCTNGMFPVARAFGAHAFKQPAVPGNIMSCVPDITSTNLTGQDMFMVLASSMLWTVLEDQEIVDIAFETAVALLHPERRHLRLSLIHDRPLGAHGFPTVPPDSTEERRQSEAEMARVIARELVQEAHERGGQGDIACLVVFL